MTRTRVGNGSWVIESVGKAFSRVMLVMGDGSRGAKTVESQADHESNGLASGVLWVM